MFDNPAEIKANPDHRLVKIAYAGARRILSRLSQPAPAPGDKQ
jgi:hypothetical protein